MAAAHYRQLKVFLKCYGVHGQDVSSIGDRNVKQTLLLLLLLTYHSLTGQFTWTYCRSD